MDQTSHSIINKINSEYKQLSGSEKRIADYILNLPDLENMSAKDLAKTLYVSEATLSRFAQKLGFSGYREFMFFYKHSQSTSEQKFNQLTQNVMNTYKELLDKTTTHIDEEQIKRISSRLSKAQHVFIYGVGNSSMVAQEFKIRFMRLGLPVEAISDFHMMKMNSIHMKPNTILICLSVSGKNLRSFIKEAKLKKSYTVMFTSKKEAALTHICDEIVECPSIERLEVGNVISPQFPLLIMIDILYAHYYVEDYYQKLILLQDTLSYVES